MGQRPHSESDLFIIIFLQIQSCQTINIINVPNGIMSRENMLARRGIETRGREEGVRETNRSPLALSALERKHGSRGQDVWRSASFPKCGSGLIPPGLRLSAGPCLQTAVRLFSGSRKHSTSLSWSPTIRCLVTKWPSSFIFIFGVHTKCSIRNPINLFYTLFLKWSLIALTIDVCSNCWLCFH